MPFFVVLYQYAPGQVPSQGSVLIASADQDIIATLADAFQEKLKGKTPSEVRQLGHRPLAVAKPAGKPPTLPPRGGGTNGTKVAPPAPPDACPMTDDQPDDDAS
jgi:hypothetical protein